MQHVYTPIDHTTVGWLGRTKTVLHNVHVGFLLLLDFDIALGILQQSLVKEPVSMPIGVVHGVGTSNSSALKASLTRRNLYIAGMGLIQEPPFGEVFQSTID